MKVIKIINEKQVKAYLNEKDIKVSKDFYEFFDVHVKHILDDAYVRARANQRSTVMKRDL